MQPFEDQITRWLGPFTAEELIASFREMGTEWEKGLAILQECLRAQGKAGELQRQHAVAAAARLQFLSMDNVIEFYMLRDRLPDVEATARPSLIRRMRKVVLDDIRLAEQMKTYVALDCAIGFESEIYDYSYSAATIEAKIRHDRLSAATLVRWEKQGADMDVLHRSLPAPLPVKRPAPGWREWLAWGD